MGFKDRGVVEPLAPLHVIIHLQTTNESTTQGISQLSAIKHQALRARTTGKRISQGSFGLYQERALQLHLLAFSNRTWRKSLVQTGRTWYTPDLQFTFSRRNFRQLSPTRNQSTDTQQLFQLSTINAESNDKTIHTKPSHQATSRPTSSAIRTPVAAPDHAVNYGGFIKTELTLRQFT